MSKLKELRNAKGMTTKELGRLIGVTPSAVTNWETGAREPNIEKIKALCAALSCTADELLGIKAEV